MSVSSSVERPLASPPRPAVPAVVHQHAEDAAVLRQVRSVLVRAPHVKLLQLQRLDDRLTAHLAGLAVAGPFGAACCMAALDPPSPGRVFAAAANAIMSRDVQAVDRLVAITAAVPQAERGLASAFGWVSAQQLQGLVHPLLNAPDPLRQAIGLAACRMHHVEPGSRLATALEATHPQLRSQAIRTAVALGRMDLRDAVRMSLQDPASSLEAAAALCLLDPDGRESALEALRKCTLGDDGAPEGTEPAALALLLQAAEFKLAQHLVSSIAKTAADNPSQDRQVLRACGVLGDVQLVPWLIERMDDQKHARLAGESFALIAGVDLAAQDLDRKDSPTSDAGPNDDPSDDNVALDEDESLPWPDRDAVQRWWTHHATEMPSGSRCFMGGPVSVEHCEHVLRAGTQRQRSVAARWLCILLPGRKLFNIAAPARRQRRLLGLTP